MNSIYPNGTTIEFIRIPWLLRPILNAQPSILNLSPHNSFLFISQTDFSSPEAGDWRFSFSFFSWFVKRFLSFYWGRLSLTMTVCRCSPELISVQCSLEGLSNALSATSDGLDRKKTVWPFRNSLIALCEIFLGNIRHATRKKGISFPVLAVFSDVAKLFFCSRIFLLVASLSSLLWVEVDKWLRWVGDINIRLLLSLITSCHLQNHSSKDGDKRAS